MICHVCRTPNPESVTCNNLPLFRCSSCGLLWRQDFDVPLAYYDEADAGSTPARRSARMRNCKDRIALMRRYMPIVHVCDVGTGEGTFLEALKEAGGSGVGIEPGKKYVAEAQTHGVRIVGATEADAAGVVQQEGIQSFTLFHVIEHVPNPRQTLQTLFDALPPGGCILLETPTMDSPILRAKQYQDALIYPEHLFYFNDTNLPRLLDEVGFRVVAHGRRDFDQYHLPIRESLRRLFLRFPKQPPTKQAGAGHEPIAAAEMRSSWVRSVVRILLARLVIASGRLNYQWVIAQK